MKYIVFWEFRPEDFEKVLKKGVMAQKEEAENPDKYVKYLFRPHSIGAQPKGFSIVEGTPEQVVNSVLLWSPELKTKHMPIFDADMFGAQYMKNQ